MKIYLFNPETGVYLGEDFADENSLERGTYVIPADATTIAPPPVGQGEVPVFDKRENRWEVRRISALQRNPLNDKIGRNILSQESL